MRLRVVAPNLLLKLVATSQHQPVACRQAAARINAQAPVTTPLDLVTSSVEVPQLALQSVALSQLKQTDAPSLRQVKALIHITAGADREDARGVATFQAVAFDRNEGRRRLQQQILTAAPVETQAEEEVLHTKRSHWTPSA